MLLIQNSIADLASYQVNFDSVGDLGKFCQSSFYCSVLSAAQNQHFRHAAHECFTSKKEEILSCKLQSK